MKKLVVVSDRLYGGGTERFLSLLSLYAPPTVEVVFVVFEEGISYPFKSRIYVLKDYKNGAFIEFLNTFLQLYKILLKEKADAVLCCKRKRRLMVSLCFGFNRIMHVENYEKPILLGLRGKIPYFIKTRLLYRLFRKIIPMSKGIAQHFISHYKFPPKKINVVYNPVDIDYVERLAREPLSECEQEIFKSPVITTVGWLNKQKGHWHLIRSFKIVNENCPDCRLVLIGDGPLRKYLEELVNSLRLGDKIFFLGWKSNPFKYLARSTIFCLPSLWEGFAIVIAEALACGLPVMASDCLSGPREILAPDTEYKVEKLLEPEYGKYGILMPVFDGKMYNAGDPLTWQEKVWGNEIVKLLKNPSLLEEYRMKSKSRAMCFEVRKQINEFIKAIFDNNYYM